MASKGGACSKRDIVIKWNERYIGRNTEGRLAGAVVQRRAPRRHERDDRTARLGAGGVLVLMSSPPTSQHVVIDAGLRSRANLK